MNSSGKHWRFVEAFAQYLMYFQRCVGNVTRALFQWFFHVHERKPRHFLVAFLLCELTEVNGSSVDSYTAQAVKRHAVKPSPALLCVRIGVGFKVLLPDPEKITERDPLRQPIDVVCVDLDRAAFAFDRRLL